MFLAVSLCETSPCSNPLVPYGTSSEPSGLGRVILKMGESNMQNLISMNLTNEQLAAVDAALTALENNLSEMVALTADQRRTMRRMGNKSEAFCRQTLSLLEQNPQIVNPNLGLEGVIADLACLDVLRPRLQRLTRLSERGADTQAALGSDVMSGALQGYGLLKLSGRDQGLEALRTSLGARFAKKPKVTDDEAKAA